MTLLAMKHISKSFPRNGRRMPVLEEFSLEVRAGEFVSLFGPNGSGKTTLIEIATGLALPDAGEIHYADTVRDSVIPVVFQDYRRSLLPWASVRSNILFPLELSGATEAEKKSVLADLVTEFDTDIDLDANVSTLSGGQAQMVSIMRALSVSPGLLICDEPFSALDYGARLFLQERLMSIALRRNLAILMVSHDLDEALMMGDRVVFLSRRPGRVIGEVANQLPRPRSIHDLSSDKFGELRSQCLNLFKKASGGQVELG